jgi:GMP synthase-like glutamine amidotransferase
MCGITMHLWLALVLLSSDPDVPLATASATAVGTIPAGASDGDRFATCDDSLWRGEPGQSAWWWQLDFHKPRPIGAILQILGDEPTSLQHAPASYLWQISLDGTSWTDLPDTAINGEQRAFRIFRFTTQPLARFLRIAITSARQTAPVIREIEVYSNHQIEIDFPDWIAAVSTVEHPDSLQEASPFVELARSCPGFEQIQAQRLWLQSFTPEFAGAEPRPIAAFLTGNYKDWCQRDREPWRGLQQVLKQRMLPIWGSCGGAQALAILETTGVDQPWDCPRCRDPLAPRIPIYSHIGHTAPSPCGAYEHNLAERGQYIMKRERDDPAFAGLPDLFPVMESHVGQIAYPPPGWSRIITKGPGALTENQCIKIDGFPIYAAQFHIEMKGTEQSSRAIMANFLTLARKHRSATAIQSSQAAAGPSNHPHERP